MLASWGMINFLADVKYTDVYGISDVLELPFFDPWM